MSRPLNRSILVVSLAVVVLALAQAWPGISLADHESTNELTFEPVQDSPAPNGAGEGIIDYRGGGRLDSLWTATSQFTGLAPEEQYTVVVQGRFGEDGSAGATAFTPICDFTTDANGDGGCWYYFVRLIHLSVVQVRLGDASGEVVLQATASEDGPGSITRTFNDYSATPTAFAAQTATAVAAASPGASPADE